MNTHRTKDPGLRAIHITEADMKNREMSIMDRPLDVHEHALNAFFSEENFSK